MTNVQGVGGAAGSGEALPKGPSKVMDSDAFMKLFLAQVTHQNPTKPADTSQLLQQMADISQIQASKEMQKSLTEFSKSMNITMGNAAMMNATQMIGKDVLAEIPKGGAVSLDAKKGITGAVGVPKGASDVTVTIKNPQGQVVKTLYYPVGKTNLIDFKWDGKVPDGETGKEKMADPGLYSISASANVGGKPQECSTAAGFTVNSVAVDPNGKVLFGLDVPGGRVISISDVIKFM